MHARTVIAEDWLWHEGCGFAVGVGNVVDHILIDLHVVRTHRKGLIACADSCWADATSWWCFSTIRPISPMTESISPRMSCAVSIGFMGK